MTLKTELENMQACHNAVKWVDRKSLKTAWAKCERGDWLLWYANRVGVDRKLMVLAACDCAETALQYVPAGELRPARAIQAARDWCAGTGTLETAGVAEAAGAAAWAVGAAVWAAGVAEAAGAAAWAAGAAAWAAGVAEAAGAAAWAAEAAWAAGAAGVASRKHCADLVRARIPYEIVEGLRK